MEEKRLLYYPADIGGCAWYRMRMPAITQTADILTRIIVNKEFYDNVDECYIQRQVEERLIDVIKSNFTEWIFDADDIINRDLLPDYNHCKESWQPDFEERAIEIMNVCKKVSFSTEELKNYYEPKIKSEAIVRPNKAARWWFGNHRDYDRNIMLYNRHRKRPRVLWSGSASHFDVMNTGTPDDFAHVLNDIATLAQDFQFVFLGAYPQELDPLLEKGFIEFYPWVPITDYPTMIDQLEVNFSIAPLQNSLFNRCKSNIKFLESSYLGIPCVTQDMVTYKDSFIKFKTGEEMAEHLRHLKKNPKFFQNQVRKHLDFGETMWLEDDYQ